MKHVIWSNRDLHIEDWKEGYVEYLKLNNLDLDPNDEDAIYDWMQDTNSNYLDDERTNLDIQLSRPILRIDDIGRWNGRFSGFGEISSGKIGDCLYSEMDLCEWYVDEEGDLRCDASHHDGTNYYLYRTYKDGVSDEQIEDLQNKIYDGVATREDIEAVTRRLGDEIAKVYGWELAPVKDFKALDEVISDAKQQQNGAIVENQTQRDNHEFDER